jgi:hypothetical protein
MFELADRLIGIFKTHDITKCLSIDQKPQKENQDINNNNNNRNNNKNNIATKKKN